MSVTEQWGYTRYTSVSISGILIFSGGVVIGTTNIFTAQNLPFGTANFTNSSIFISPSVTITVNAGSVLNITGCTIAGCSSMWEGIINNGGTVVIDGSTIEDAQVTLRDDFGLGIFNITNTTFNRNGVNIMLRYGNYNTSIFTNNIFKCDAPLKSTNIYNATYTYAHFHLYAISNINIGSISNTNSNP